MNAKPNNAAAMLTALGMPDDLMPAAWAFGEQVSAACDEIVLQSALVLDHLEAGEFEAAEKHGNAIIAALGTLDPMVHQSVTINLAYAVVQAARS